MGFCQTYGVVFQVSVAASAYCAACRLRLNSTHVAARPQAAAHDIHRPGAALLPLTCTSQVAIAGVKPPKSAVACLNSTHVAARPQAAAHDIHRPGAALLPLTCTSQVAIAGVKPPKSAVARLYASEKPVVRILAGMISVSATIIAPV